MSTIELEATALYTDVPLHCSPETLHKVVEMSEEAICKGQIYTSEQVKAKHPRL